MPVVGEAAAAVGTCWGGIEDVNVEARRHDIHGGKVSSLEIGDSCLEMANW